jgi:hypothetical protein
MEEREKDCCPLLDGCKLVYENKDRMPELVFRIKQAHCQDDNSKCARKWLADMLGAAQVPALMMPNQWEWARQIVEDYRATMLEQENSTASS